MQINYGYPEIVSSNFLVKRSTVYDGYAYTMFTYVPFLLEIKVITEWLETTTALDIFEWMQFQIIYGDLFKAKCGSYVPVSSPAKHAIFYIECA